MDCQRLNYENNKNSSTLVIIIDNKLCTLQMDFDQSKLKLTTLSQHSILNKVNITLIKLISLSTFPNSNHVVAGDSTESFSVFLYDSNKHKLDSIGCDLSLRYLYKSNIIIIQLL